MSEKAAKPRRSRSGRQDRKMSLAAHLIELRNRFFICLIALVIAMVVAYFLTGPIMDLITRPVDQIAETSGEKIQVEVMYTTVTGAFDLQLRMMFAVGLLLAAPVFLWQIWAFIMPGLTRKEIRYTVGFLAAAIPLFFAGAAVGLWVMPNLVKLMATFQPEGTAAFYDAKYYYDFVLKLLLVVGISFVLPVFLVALNVAGVISGRAIMKSWRVAIVIAVTVAAIATPPADVVSTLLLAGILIVLFFGAAGLSMLFDRRKRRRDEQALGLSPQVPA